MSSSNCCSYYKEWIISHNLRIGFINTYNKVVITLYKIKLRYLVIIFICNNTVRKHWTIYLRRCEIVISHFQIIVYSQLLFSLKVLCFLYHCALITASLSNCNQTWVLLPTFILIWRAHYYFESNWKFNVRNNINFTRILNNLQKLINRGWLTFRCLNWKSRWCKTWQAVWNLAISRMSRSSIFFR